jgi:predicted nucleotidyltransferase
MKPEKFDAEREKSDEIRLTPPPVELLLHPELADSAWPENLAHNQEFIAQIEARKKLADRLDAVLSRLPRPDISLQNALSKNLVTDVEISELYGSLSALLKDRDYERAVLYIPFEFLPNSSFKFPNEDLNRSAEDFKEAYLGAWRSLLGTHDVRANFVNGDVPDMEIRDDDLPRVVKAAHLIPKLVERGFINIDDVLLLMETSNDETLIQNIRETLPVLNDLGLIDERDLVRMQSSASATARETAATIKASQEESAREKVVEPISLASVQTKLHDAFLRADTMNYGDDIPEKRSVWLKGEAKRKALESAGDSVSDAIQANIFSNDAAAEFIASEADAASKKAFINGVRKAIEAIDETDAPRARTLYEEYQESLASLWDENAPETRDELSKTFCRLRGLGIVSDGELKNLHITIPALAGPFSENLKSISSETEDIKKMLATIETDAELAELVYPVVILYGSHLKGYGKENADIDIAVMVKPGTPTSARGNIQEKLRDIFAHEKIRGAITEFWLEETKEGLGIKDFAEPDAATGEKYWTHVLFGGAWEGDANAISELREKLLVPYFSDTKSTIHGRDARGLYLEEMEQDALQYRLMHKGYERFFPPYGGIRTPHADGVDGKSIFWDSGYRATAIKLFVNRVFLPKVSRKE